MRSAHDQADAADRPALTATTSGDRIRASITSPNNPPTITIGIVPAMISRPSRSYSPSRPGQRPGAAAISCADVGAKERHHRQQRADVARHVERDPEPPGIPAEKRARQDQVARARHRQELGESLHDAEQRGRRSDPRRPRLTTASSTRARPRPALGLLAAQDDGDRRRDEDRRVRAADDADEHRERERLRALRRRTDTAPARRGTWCRR